jgi:hypothetical protein
MSLKQIAIACITALAFGASAKSAEITLSPRLFGGTLIHLSGQIYQGDEITFANKIAAIGNRADTLVWLTSPGGDLVAALRIAEMVRDHGYSTMVNRYGGCASACPLIWFSGRHAIIQRESDLVFHMAFYASNRQPAPDGIFAVTTYLQTVGLTGAQAGFLANAAAPSEGWRATEAAAHALGFRPQIVSGPFAARMCQAKFCLAIP